MARSVDFERVLLATKGDVDAFAGLYDQGLRCVWAFAVRQCRSREKAEALTEAILTRAFTTLESFSGAVSWPAWLGVIAREVWAEGSDSPGAKVARRVGI